MTTLKKALNHGGTGRKTRSEAKRKQVQIATVDPETGRPSVRTVVFRGFLPQKYLMMEDDARTEESCCFCFITDDRSAKFSHLGRGEKQGAPIECCWWLDEPGVQFRIAGRTLVATARSEDQMLRAAVAEVWDRLGDSTRRQMYWPHPGAPKGEGVESLEDDKLSLDGSHFVLIIVVPDSVDELHLGGGQKRILYSRAAEAPAGEEGAGEDSTVTDTLTPGGGRGAGLLLASLRTAVWSQEAVNP